MIPNLLANIILFVLALISNATPFFGASYTWIATTVLYNYGVTTTGFVTVVLVTAIASALGKLVLYATGRSMKKRLQKSRNIAIFDQWLDQNKKRSLLIVFVTGLVPAIPVDDYVYVAAGAGVTRLGAMFTVTLLAKILKNSIEIGLIIWGFGSLFTTSLFGLSRLETSIIFSGLLLLGGMALYRIDLIKLVSKLRTARELFPSHTPR